MNFYSWLRVRAFLGMDTIADAFADIVADALADAFADSIADVVADAFADIVADVLADSIADVVADILADALRILAYVTYHVTTRLRICGRPRHASVALNVKRLA
jgi:hypothetical protein